MASETVDPIDWSHPSPSWAVPPERLLHSINQCNISGTRTCNRSMLGNHLAYAATQGIIILQYLQSTADKIFRHINHAHRISIKNVYTKDVTSLCDVTLFHTLKTTLLIQHK